MVGHSLLRERVMFFLLGRWSHCYSSKGGWLWFSRWGSWFWLLPTGGDGVVARLLPGGGEGR